MTKIQALKSDLTEAYSKVLNESNDEYSVVYLSSGGQSTQGVKRVQRMRKVFRTYEQMKKWLDDAENDMITGFIDVLELSSAYDKAEAGQM